MDNLASFHFPGGAAFYFKENEFPLSAGTSQRSAVTKCMDFSQCSADAVGRAALSWAHGGGESCARAVDFRSWLRSFSFLILPHLKLGQWCVLIFILKNTAFTFPPTSFNQTSFSHVLLWKIFGLLEGNKNHVRILFPINPSESVPSTTIRQQMDFPFVFKLDLGFNRRNTV